MWAHSNGYLFLRLTRRNLWFSFAPFSSPEITIERKQPSVTPISSGSVWQGRQRRTCIEVPCVLCVWYAADVTGRLCDLGLFNPNCSRGCVHRHIDHYSKSMASQAWTKSARAIPGDQHAHSGDVGTERRYLLSGVASHPQRWPDFGSSD